MTNSKPGHTGAPVHDPDEQLELPIRWATNGRLCWPPMLPLSNRFGFVEEAQWYHILISIFPGYARHEKDSRGQKDAGPLVSCKERRAAVVLVTNCLSTGYHVFWSGLNRNLICPCFRGDVQDCCLRHSEVEMVGRPLAEPFRATPPRSRPPR